MPAQDNTDKHASNNYWHVYNKSIGDNLVFRDKDDCDIFISFLSEYLSPPRNADEVKTQFTINGHTYQGTPHLVKNYHNSIELIAYGLHASGFDLLINEKNPGTLNKFMRSLTTRYSMNYNKKYKRSGALFSGPYKCDLICDDKLKEISALIHNNQYSSLSDYQGNSKTPWIHPQIILSSPESQDYTEYLRNFKTELHNLPLESSRLERNNPASELTSGNIQPSQSIATLSEIAFLAVMFLGLFSIGLKNVMAYQPATPTPLAQAIRPDSLEVKTLGVKDSNQKGRIKIINTSDLIWVNVYSQPQINAKVITKTQAGDTFEYSTLASGWYEIKLPDNSTGYVLAENAEIINNNE